MLTATRVSSVLAVSAALVASVALPATAAEPIADTTLVTLTVGAGSLAISAPETASFGQVTPGLPATVEVPGVQVTDARAAIVTWDASVAMNDFKGFNTGRTIPASSVVYTTLGTTLIETTNAAVVPKATATLSTAAQSILTATAVGNNTVKWSPTLAMVIPLDTIADTYTATLTHSVI